MDEVVFNMAIRRFLKEVGVSSQREIERAVQQALETGRLTGMETLQARATIVLEGVDLRHDVAGEIALA